ncbi:hypothetical protein LTR27_004523 [Elasticomyces elasticus]|nr:hypothetical protein LTR27_004523 [Elasticomyces elasticus]
MAKRMCVDKHAWYRYLCQAIMWLINVTSFRLEWFVGRNIPSYAILSHVWSQNAEVTFEDRQDLRAMSKKRGTDKIRLVCEQARKDGLQYAWVDTCEISLRSSAT